MNLFKKEYKPEDEIVISERIGFPYNILPRGYPTKVDDKKINEVMEKFLENLKGNAGVDQIVNRDITFINLGLNELNNRHSRRQSQIASFVSWTSLIVAAASLVVAIIAL